MKLEEAWEILGRFPHCDQHILHAPSNCEFCDQHSDWQAYRVAMGINFTGERDPEKLPCPSEKFRTPEMAQRWYGNQAKPAQVWIVTPNYYGEFVPTSTPRYQVNENAAMYGSREAAQEAADQLNSKYK